MSHPNAISIKLEISIPTGAGQPPVLVSTTQQNARSRAVNQWCPADGAHHPVRPTGSGSGGNTGSICARVQLATPVAPGRDVVAQVVQVDPDSLGDSPNLSVTIAGTPDSTRTVWSWCGSKELPHVDHDASTLGRTNFFVIWEPDGSTHWFRQNVSFFGHTGTADPCGTPSGNPCGSGSGSWTAMAPARQAAPATYPAVWLVAVAGLDGPLALFNATWALREARGAATPNWDNAGDGKTSPAVSLRLCPKAGWELVLRFNGTEKRWAVPYQGNLFGPLAFLPGQSGQPVILASTI